MKRNIYLEALAFMGVGGAHPGGLQLTKYILERENPSANMYILDAGCGTGQTAAYIAEKYSCQVVALDNSELMLNKARDRFSYLKLPIETQLGDTENLPFQDDIFDIVLSESVISFTNFIQTIKEFKRVLKPNGMLYAVEMVLEDQQLSDQECKKIKTFYGMDQLLTEFEWSKAFQNGGFKNICIEKFVDMIDDHVPETAPDFTPSDDVEAKHVDILFEHMELTKAYKDVLGYRIFKCFS